MCKKIAFLGIMPMFLLVAGADAVQIASVDYVESKNTAQTTEIQTWVDGQGYITDADIAAKVDSDALGTAAFESVTSFATAAQGATATATDSALTTNNTIAKANSALQTADMTGYATTTSVATTVETYAIPKPSANCMGAQAQCVLTINKNDGSIYWEDVAVPQP